MKEELIVSLTADIKDLSAKLKEAQDKLQSFGNETQKGLNGITLNNLKSQLKGLNTELNNTSIGSSRFKVLKDEITKVEDKIKSLKSSSSKIGDVNLPTNKVNTFNASLGNLGDTIKTLALGYISLQAATEALGRSFNVALRLDAFNSAMAVVLGSTEQAEMQFQKLADISNKLGLDLSSLSTIYKDFAGATITAGVSQAQTNAIFESFANAGAKLKLSSEDISGSLRAVQQMFSKGTVQAEELRGQLGERLPGAFALAARAMGVTTMQLGKMLENGQVLATDLLPKLAAELDKTFGTTDKVDSLQASVNRLNNTFTLAVKNGNIATFFKGGVDAANDLLNVIESKSWGEFFKRFASIGNTGVTTQLNAANDALAGINDQLIKSKQLANGTIKFDFAAKEFLLNLDEQKKIQNELNARIKDKVSFEKLSVAEQGKLTMELARQMALVKELEKAKANKPKGIVLADGSIAKAEADLKALTLERSKTKVGSDKYLELSKSIDIATKSLEKLQLLELKIKLGDTTTFNLDNVNPFAEVDLSSLKEATKQVNDLQASMNLLLSDSLQLQQIGGETFTPINDGVVITNEEVTKLNDNAMALVSTLGNTLTSAFDSALISGENFGVTLIKAIGDLIKKLLAAVATAAILSAILSSFGVGAVAIGGKEGASLFGTIIKNLTGFSGAGKPSGNRVASGVTTNSGGSVEFEIRGDKLYGVLQNYSGRLDRLV